MKNSTLSILFALIINLGYAQIRCGNPMLWNHALQRDTSFGEALKKERIRVANIASPENDSLKIIPVVVHIMYAPEDALYGNGSNITDAVIASQIAVLNEDFQRFNADTVQTPSYFTNAAANTKFQFCLAQIDPNGDSTTGITRQMYAKSTRHDYILDDENMKTQVVWNQLNYLNIWVVKGMVGGLLGYCPSPELIQIGAYKQSQDGVVIAAPFFGSLDKTPADSAIMLTQPRFNKGRTATHEVGHYFNLIHIWGDGDCSIDDDVFDTPLCSNQFLGCKVPGPVQCGNERMVQNYMDYTDDACLNLFTQGQAQRMHSSFTAYSFRQMLGKSPQQLTTCEDLKLLLVDTNKLTLDAESGLHNIDVLVENSQGQPKANIPVQINILTAPLNSKPISPILLSTNNLGRVSYSFNTSNTEGKYTFAAKLINQAQSIEFERLLVSDQYFSVKILANPLIEKTLIIELLQNKVEPLSMEIFNSIGQRIYSKESSIYDSGLVYVDLSAVAAGSYFLKVNTTNKTNYLPFVVW